MKEFNTNDFVTMTDEDLEQAYGGGHPNFWNFSKAVFLGAAGGAITGVDGGPYGVLVGAVGGAMAGAASYRY